MAAPNTGPPTQPATTGPFEVTVVVPVMNEAENIAPLSAEISAALDGVAEYEIVFVDDGSTDATWQRLKELAGRIPNLRRLRHRTRRGQSVAIVTGVLAARAPVIVTMDGDGQNDPADIPKLLARHRQAQDGDALLVAGQRAKRRDTWTKRLSSRIANWVRAGLLGDNTPDTGCGLKVFTRQAFLHMPRFDHMHRFLPALMIRAGGEVVSVPVHHRPRAGGVSKYGVLDRLGVGIVDLLGVMWLKRRGIAADVEGDEGRDT